MSTNVAKCILIVESDSTFSVPLANLLIDNGYSVKVESNGKQVLDLIGCDEPDLVTLTHQMPEIDGLTICRQVRAAYEGPILMLSESADAIDEVAGLEVGADNVLVKSAPARVILAHIRAQLRRYEKHLERPKHRLGDPTSPHAQKVHTDLINLGALRIDLSARKVTVLGREAHLTDAEFDLLCLLSKHAGHAVTRSAIARELRGLEHDGFDRTIDLRISRIRKKLGDDPRYPRIIRSVRGVGYLVHR